MNQREWDDRFLAEDQHVHRIVILRQRLRNEAVIRRVIDRRIEDTIELDQAAGFIQLVFDARSEWNLDDAVKLQGDSLAGSHVVPRMNHVCRGSGSRRPGSEGKYIFPQSRTGLEAYKSDAYSPVINRMRVYSGALLRARGPFQRGKSEELTAPPCPSRHPAR